MGLPFCEGDEIHLCVSFYTKIKKETHFSTHESPFSGHESPIFGHKSPISGHESPISGHESPISGHESPISGHESRLFDPQNTHFLLDFQGICESAKASSKKPLFFSITYF